MELKELARLGAQTRIAELIAEIEALIKAFPDLGKSPARTGTLARSDQPTRRKRRKVSATTRAKMRAAWARRKAVSIEAGVAAPAAPAQTTEKNRKHAGRYPPPARRESRSAEEAVGGDQEGEEEGIVLCSPLWLKCDHPPSRYRSNVVASIISDGIIIAGDERGKPHTGLPRSIHDELYLEPSPSP